MSARWWEVVWSLQTTATVENKHGRLFSMVVVVAVLVSPRHRRRQLQVWSLSSLVIGVVVVVVPNSMFALKRVAAILSAKEITEESRAHLCSLLLRLCRSGEGRVVCVMVMVGEDDVAKFGLRISLIKFKYTVLGN